MKASVGKRVVDRLQEFAEALENKEVVSERFTCRRFTLELQPTTYSPELVKGTRDLLNASQAVFAMFLGVSRGTVRRWELGTNEPSDMACRFMDEIRSNPELFRERLRAAVCKRVPATSK
jgi:putative transcriptional regulator